MQDDNEAMLCGQDDISKKRVQNNKEISFTICFKTTQNKKIFINLKSFLAFKKTINKFLKFLIIYQ